VLAGLPHGVLVVDRGGAVVAANPAAGRLFGVGEAALTGRSCCELLGCRGHAGPLAGACLAELARASAGPLPEVRFDLPLDAPAGAVWASASSLGSDGDATAAAAGNGGEEVVVALRSASARDRRRRTDPHWITGPALRIHTLGRTRVESVEGALDGAWLLTRRGQVLKYLLCQRHRVTEADEIAAAIWPHSGRAALANVRHVIHGLRELLEPGRPRRAPSSFVVSRRGGYLLDPATVAVDVDEFEESVRAGLSGRGEEGGCSSAERLEHALSLYEGDFLADEPYAEWALGERDRLRELAAEALRTLTEAAVRKGDLGAAADHLRRLADMHPFDVDVQREFIALCVRRGRRSDAMRRYVALRGRLYEHFGERLEFDLTDLGSEDGSPAPAANA
jgi:DNA-binding SARP family transcriptional activator